MRIFSQTRFINFLLLVALCIISATGINAYKQIQRLVNANTLVVHTHTVIETANQLLLALADAESRINFFVMTEDPDQEIIRNVPDLMIAAKEHLILLKDLTHDNPKQAKRIEPLELAIQEKLNYMQTILTGYKEGGKKAAYQLADLPRRRQLKGRISHMVSEINQDEYELLKKRTELSLIDADKSGDMLIISTLGSTLLLLMSFIVLNYYSIKKTRAEQKQLKAEKDLLLANKMLHESEERLTLATEGSGVGLWDWIPNTDYVFYANHFRKIIGYDEKEFPNSLESFDRIVHPDDKDRLWEAVNKHLEDHVPFKIEYRLKLKSGEYHWFQAAGQAIWDKDNVPVRMSGSVIDITTRKKTEQQLAIQYAISYLLSESSKYEDSMLIEIVKVICENLNFEVGGVWRVDNRENAVVNLGYWQSSTITSKVFEDVTRSMKLSPGVGLPGRVWTTGQAAWIMDLNKETNFPRLPQAKALGLHSAFCFPIFIENKVLGMFEFFTRDSQVFDESLLRIMTTMGVQIGQFIQRKKMEDELRESEAYKMAVLASVMDAIMTVDEQGNILSANPQTQNLFGYSETELSNKKIESMIGIGSLSDIVGKEVGSTAIRKDRISFPVELMVSQMQYNNETIYVIVVRDVTERERINKMKNEFVSVVSHELRTPLTSIKGSIGLVLGGAVGSFTEKAQKLLAIANNNCERLLLLINDILDIEKIESGKMNFKLSTVEIDKLVHESVAANKMYGEKFGVNIRFDQPDTKIKVNADPGRLLQVLANLISNAVKFSPQGGEVILSVEQINEKVRVSVADKGVGIPNEFQSRIFQKFSQADSSDSRSKGGTGLGLNITKAIIEKLNGTLNFVSEENVGTTFYFELPVDGEQVPVVADEKIILPGSAEKKSLLICEDDEDQAGYLKALLESSNFNVDIAFTVLEAKKLLLEHQYDALLLDLILPDQDGITFIRDLRNAEKTKKIPIIVVSVIAKTGKSILNGEAFSVVDWLDKPVDFEKLLSAISHVKKQGRLEKPNVLHVEDDPDTQRMMKLILADAATITFASTLNKAREIMLTQTFDLVILDLLLPDGNGAELISLFAEKKIPVVVYSSMSLSDEHARHVCGVLAKSQVSPAQLLKKIKGILEIHS